MWSIALTNIYRLLPSCTQNEAYAYAYAHVDSWSTWARNYFFSQNIYYIYIEDLLKNLSLQMYATNSVSLSHIHNRESGIVCHLFNSTLWKWTSRVKKIGSPENYPLYFIMTHALKKLWKFYMTLHNEDSLLFLFYPVPHRALPPLLVFS